MIDKFVNEDSDKECSSCRSMIDVKSVRIGIHQCYAMNIALCKSCRSLLHKRLHEEGKENVNP